MSWQLESAKAAGVITFAHLPVLSMLMDSYKYQHPDVIGMDSKHLYDVMLQDSSDNGFFSLNTEDIFALLNETGSLALLATLIFGIWGGVNYLRGSGR